MKSNNYSVTKYGKEWAIFCATSRCYVLFGSKKEMNERCNELNKVDCIDSNTLMPNSDLTYNEYARFTQD